MTNLQTQVNENILKLPIGLRGKKFNQPISYAKYCLKKNNFAQALEIVKGLHFADLTEADKADVVAIQIRSLAVDGRYQESLQNCNELLSQDISAVLQMRVFALRMVCLYELGDFSAAKKDVDKIYQIAQLYPLSPEWRLARALHVKLLARQGHYDLAESILTATVRKVHRKDKLDAGDLLTFARAKLELQRSQGEDWSGAAQACLKLAEIVGDDLCRESAHFELAALRQSEEIGLRAELAQSQCGLVKRFIDSMFDRDLPFTSVQSLKQYIQGNSSQSENQVKRELGREIIFSEWGIIYDFESSQVREFSATPRTAEILKTLRRGVMSKADFFSITWQIKNFVLHLHDQVVHVALGRVRKELGIDLRVVEGNVVLTGALVL